MIGSDERGAAGAARRSERAEKPDAGPGLPPGTALTPPQTQRAGRRQRQVMLLAVTVPFAGFLVAAATWQATMGPLALALLAGMYALSLTGVTVGYHRHFAHRAFQAPRAVRCVLAILGATAAQGPVISWVAYHRRHHHHSDAPGDPHSPHLHGGGAREWLRGLWHAHLGWTFAPQDIREWQRYAPELLRDPAIFAVHRRYFLWVALGLFLPALLGGLLTESWPGAVYGFLWGGLVRLFLLQHVTFSVNSICHTFGSRAFETPDHSRNNFWLAALAFGEGWHNNHHAFPTAPAFGRRWWQIDVGWWIIRALHRAGLASDLRLPSPAALQRWEEAGPQREFGETRGARP